MRLRLVYCAKPIYFLSGASYFRKKKKGKDSRNCKGIELVRVVSDGRKGRAAQLQLEENRHKDI